jgi:hypothetical protein
MTELAWETRDHYDPLVIGERTADALVKVTQRITASDPILDVVNVMNKNYNEIGEFVNTRFGTPFVEFESELKEPDAFHVLGGNQPQPTGIENFDSVQ